MKKQILTGAESFEEIIEGYERIYKYGIAFHKKNCEVAMETVTCGLK